MSEKHMEEKDDMSYRTMAKKILFFVWPIMLANILQISFNFADTLVVGNFVSEKGLAAVGSAAPLIVFFTWGLNGLSLGADVLISRMIGANRHERIPNAVFTAIFIALVFGSLIAAFGFLFADALLILLRTPADILADTTVYTRIYFLACPAIAVYHFGSSVLRANGNTKDPTLFLAISGAVNVLLNLLFATEEGTGKGQTEDRSETFRQRAHADNAKIRRTVCTPEPALLLQQHYDSVEHQFLRFSLCRSQYGSQRH